MKNRVVAFSFRTLALATLSWMCLSACSDSQGFSARGTVEQIEYGKDGYTAQLKGDDGKAFAAVISRVKMEKQYRVLKVGDRVELWGDTIHLENKVRIIVNRIE